MPAKGDQMPGNPSASAAQTRHRANFVVKDEALSAHNLGTDVTDAAQMPGSAITAAAAKLRHRIEFVDCLLST